MTELTLYEKHILFQIATIGTIDSIRIDKRLVTVYYYLRGKVKIEDKIFYKKLTVPAECFRKLMQFYPDRNDTFVEIKEEYHNMCNDYITKYLKGE